MPCKCAECGYLAALKPKTDKLVGVDSRIRTPGPDGERAIRATVHDGTVPYCYVAAMDLQAELPNQDAADMHKVIHQNRECNDFVKWIPGISPKKHQKMIQQHLLMEWQKKREDEDREWREQQRREDLAWKANQERAAKWQLFWQIVVMGLLVSGVALWSAKIQADAARDAARMTIEAGRNGSH